MAARPDKDADSDASMAVNGFTDLPAGKLSTVVTYLDMTAPPPARAPKRDDLVLARMDAPSVDGYRALYKRIGLDWLWIDRLLMPDDALQALLDAETTEVYAARRDGVDIGLLELDFADPENVELAYFGLVPEAIGDGVGRWLMDHAIRLGFRDATRRLWVHTCTLDHPAALGFYVRSGFKPYKRAVDVFDDPRLTGVVPADAQAWNPPIPPG